MAERVVWARDVIVSAYTNDFVTITGRGWVLDLDKYEARRIAALLMRPNAREIGEQLHAALVKLKDSDD